MSRALFSKHSATANSPLQPSGAHILHGLSVVHGASEEAEAGEVWNHQDSKHIRVDCRSKLMASLKA